MASIAEIYRTTRKVPDLIWNRYVCRPLAAVVVRALAATPITPNQITIASLLVAFGAAGMLLGIPGPGGLILGVVVYELSYVLDCADGMLARWRGTQSTRGHLFDFLMDEIKAFVILAAVAVRLFVERQDPLFLLLGVGGLVALATGISITTFQRRPEIAPASAGSAPQAPRGVLRRLVGLAEQGAKFLIHYPSYIWIAALVGLEEVYFYPYLAVNAAYAARSLLGVALSFGRAA